MRIALTLFTLALASSLTTALAPTALASSTTVPVAKGGEEKSGVRVRVSAERTEQWTRLTLTVPAGQEKLRNHFATELRVRQAREGLLVSAPLQTSPDAKNDLTVSFAVAPDAIDRTSVLLRCGHDEAGALLETVYEVDVASYLKDPAAAGAGGDAPPLLKDYRGDVALPPELYRTYEELVAAFEAGKREDIQKFCVAGVAFTTEPRPQDGRFHGEDINLPFLRDGFRKSVLNLRKDGDAEYLLRTGTTSLWFAKQADGTWKLTRYADKPIK